MQQLVFGLAASAILLVIAASQFLFFGHIDTAVDGLGLLQVLWLRENHTPINAIASIHEPSIHNLRKAGMVKNELHSMIGVKNRD